MHTQMHAHTHKHTSVYIPFVMAPEVSCSLPVSQQAVSLAVPGLSSSSPLAPRGRKGWGEGGREERRKDSVGRKRKGEGGKKEEDGKKRE